MIRRLLIVLFAAALAACTPELLPETSNAGADIGGCYFHHGACFRPSCLRTRAHILSHAGRPKWVGH